MYGYEKVNSGSMVPGKGFLIEALLQFTLYCPPTPTFSSPPSPSVCPSHPPVGSSCLPSLFVSLPLPHHFSLSPVRLLSLFLSPFVSPSPSLSPLWPLCLERLTDRLPSFSLPHCLLLPLPPGPLTQAALACCCSDGSEPGRAQGPDRRRGLARPARPGLDSCVGCLHYRLHPP